MTAEQLQQDPSFRLLLILPHDNLLPFLQEQLSSKSRTIYYYIGLHIVILASIIVIGAMDISTGMISWNGIFKSFGLGALLVFTVLIIIHEGIHGLAYKIAGAPKISFGVNWRKLYFYAAADQFVVSRKSFLFIALAPFIVISSVSLAGLFFAGVSLKWVLLSVLLVHTGACAGDFAMLAFYEKHRHVGKLLTFDDVERKISYFYVKGEV